MLGWKLVFWHPELFVTSCCVPLLLDSARFLRKPGIDSILNHTVA